MSTKKSETNVRPPIIAVMGHVDHGKSTLLDYIRKANTVAGEAGGITQHLSAYEAVHATKDGKKHTIVFLDTPGHAAFSEMRSRGARVADIAILVVSAEDGVQAQTKEALSQIREAGVPFVVAFTKSDKPNANIERAKNSLLENEVYLEGMGGDISYVAVSGKTGQGIEELLDILLLVAEVAGFTADPSSAAEGVVIESHVDPKRGISATLIVRNGTLHKGEFIVTEGAFAPVRAVENYAGETIDSAGPSIPVRITGFTALPPVGAFFTIKDSKKDAERAISEQGTENAKPFTEHVKDDEARIVIPIILKTDVFGTLEALTREVRKLSNEHVCIKIIHADVGVLTENDIKVASSATNPIVLGFHTNADKRAVQMAERLEITIHTFDIIYKLLEWLAEEIDRRIPKEFKQEIVGRAEILKVFSSDKQRHVIGGRVVEGVMQNNSDFRLIRRNHTVTQGRIVELQQQRARVNEVPTGKEFGMMVESKMEPAKGDIIELFVMKE